MERSLAGKLDDKVISDQIATRDEDDEAAITLLRIKSFSVSNEEATTLTVKEHETSLQDEEKDEEKDEERDVHTPLGNHSDNRHARKYSAPVVSSGDNTEEPVRPSRVSLQEEPFHKSRVPRKSVLKRTQVTGTSSTYDSTTYPPQSPNPSSSSNGSGYRSPIQQDQKCCVVM